MPISPRRPLAAVITAGLALTLAACASHPSRGAYEPPPVARPVPPAPGYGYGQPVPSTGYGQPVPPGAGARVHAAWGRVEAIERVRGEGGASGTGAVIGGVVGAVVGRNIVGGSDRTAGTVVGAAAGALIGHAIEKDQARPREFYRVTIRMHDGSVRSVDYADLGDLGDLRVGDRVRVEGQQLYRP